MDAVANTRASSVSPPKEMLSVVETENFATKVFSNVVNSTQQFVNSARERVWGDGWWIPKDNDELVVVPSTALKKLSQIKETGDRFALCQSTFDGTGTVYQILIKWKETKKLSILRSKDRQSATDYFEHLIQYATIFPFIGHTKDLKNLLSILAHHYKWLPVHIAAEMGLKEYFVMAKNENKLAKLLSLSSQPEQRLPLHIVIENNHVDLARYLLSTGDTSLSATDVNGQNALHYAASASSQMIQTLFEFPEAKECLNWLSKDGYTPLFMSIKSCSPTCTAALLKQGATLNMLCQGRSALHEAMLQNKGNIKEVIKTLVEASPDVITNADPTTGNSALHLATNKTSLSALVEVCPQLNLNIVNKNGRTALHCHTYRCDLGCVVALATANADLDVQDSEGNTALHIAVYKECLDLVKGLLVLGADPNIVNAHGHTPRHAAAKSKDKKDEILRCLIVCQANRCKTNISGCASTCAFKELEKEDSCCEDNLMPETEATKPPVVPDFELYQQNQYIERVVNMHKKGKRMHILLSLDGGGIRGLILVKILMYIEQELGEPLSNYVDWAAGTSTGAFLAGGLAVGKSLKDCQNIYLRFKDQLFEAWARPYSAEVLEKLIKQEMGENVTLGDIEHPRLMITTTIADVQPIKLHLFRSYRLPLSLEENDKLGYGDPKDVLLWKALRCSSAAPTYFSNVDKKYVDGGLISNNPTSELLSEVHKHNAAAAYKKKESEKIFVGCVLSVGTGRIPETPMECLSISTSNVWDSMTALKNLGIILVDQVTATEGLPVERARSWCHDLRVPYYRFCTPLSKEYMLDTKEDKEVIQMMWETIEYMCKEKEQVKKLVELLKSLKK